MTNLTATRIPRTLAKIVVMFWFGGPVFAQAPNSPFTAVNPFIGTGPDGHTFPGATVPFGMVQL